MYIMKQYIYDNDNDHDNKKTYIILSKLVGFIGEREREREREGGGGGGCSGLVPMYSRTTMLSLLT